ncbi:hypothetical protein [Sorangium sp. So ce1078]
MSFRGTDALPDRRIYDRSVRQLELQILAQISDANDWIAVAQYS